MDILEQIRANNDPNSEMRRRFREQVAPVLAAQKTGDTDRTNRNVNDPELASLGTYHENGLTSTVKY